MAYTQINITEETKQELIKLQKKYDIKMDELIKLMIYVLNMNNSEGE